MRLKEIRLNKGITQQKLAHETGVPYRTIQLYESGEGSPSLNAIVSLADFLIVSIDYLIGRSDINQPPSIKSEVHK